MKTRSEKETARGRRRRQETREIGTSTNESERAAMWRKSLRRETAEGRTEKDNRNE